METLTTWLPAPALAELSDDEVHVWRAALDWPVEQLVEFHKTLSAEEQEKAARFHFEKDQRRYTAAHGILRTILGRYLSLPSEQLRFSHNAFGKPELAPCSVPGLLRFNMAHSHSLALYAFNRRRQIGIDLERLRAGIAIGEIADRFFASAEAAVLRPLPEEARTKAFFRCWTRKEAFIKARGLGLSLPLDQFTVSLVPGEPAALLSVEGDAEAASRWTLREFEVGDDFEAALAVEEHGWELKCFDWTGC